MYLPHVSEPWFLSVSGAMPRQVCVPHSKSSIYIPQDFALKFSKTFTTQLLAHIAIRSGCTCFYVRDVQLGYSAAVNILLVPWTPQYPGPKHRCIPVTTHLPISA